MDGPSTPWDNREQHTALIIIFLPSFLHPPILSPLLKIIAGHNGAELANKQGIKRINYLSLETCKLNQFERNF